MLTAAQYPFDEYGDVKGGTGYNYQSLIERFGTPGNLVYISEVRTAKLNDRAKIAPGIFGGVIDIDTQFVRLTT